MPKKPSPELPSNTSEGLPQVVLDCDFSWQAIADGGRQDLEAAIGRSIANRRWFGAKTKTIRAVQLIDMTIFRAEACLAIARIDYSAGPGDLYQIPLGMATGPKAAQIASEHPAQWWAAVQVRDSDVPRLLYDGLIDADFCLAWLRLIQSQSELPGIAGRVVGWKTDTFQQSGRPDLWELTPRLVDAEQSNSSIVFGEKLILKLYRRIETGTNPDLEITAYLARQGFGHVPPLAGAIEYRSADREPWALAMLQGFVPNQGDAWSYTLARLADFFPRLIASPRHDDFLRVDPVRASNLGEPVIPAPVVQLLADFLSDARLLATRTAEMHLALAAGVDDPAMAPELFSPRDQRDFCEHSRAMIAETCELLQSRGLHLPATLAVRAARLSERQPILMARFDQLASRRFHVHRIRCHGDYHLGQVLRTAEDFVILDFEGEPARPIEERRQRALAVRDLAGMIRSYHYAICTAASRARQQFPTIEPAHIDRCAVAWHHWISQMFLSSYLHSATAAGSMQPSFLPADEEEFTDLLDACVLEKAIYELRYELNNRPDWIYLPLSAIEDLAYRDAPS